MWLGAGILAVWLGVRLLSTGSAASTAQTYWNPKSAAAYLDRRADWWIAWPSTALDHGTICISCHTALPYALSRPVLRSSLGEQAASANERRILDSVAKRVRRWKEAKPFYGDRDGAQKSLQSRGTESVLNALILASFDARNGKRSDDTVTAFQNMWALQETTGKEKGAWPWLDFGNEPFEASSFMESLSQLSQSAPFPGTFAPCRTFKTT